MHCKVGGKAKIATTRAGYQFNISCAPRCCTFWKINVLQNESGSKACRRFEKACVRIWQSGWKMQTLQIHQVCQAGHSFWIKRESMQMLFVQSAKCSVYKLGQHGTVPQYVPCLQTLRFPEGTARSGCPMRSSLALDHDIPQTPHELGECHHRIFPSFSSETSVVQCHFFCLLCMESP